MTTPHRTALALAAGCLAALAGAAPAHAADATELTLYRSDSAALYASNGDGSVDDGYAVVREQRALTLAAGAHDVVIGDLPNALDPEALALGFPDGDAKVISQRLLLAQGSSAALTGLTGHAVDVLGARRLAAGQRHPVARRRWSAGARRQRQHHAGAQLRRRAHHRRRFPTGSSLSLRVDAARSWPGQGRTQLSHLRSRLARRLCGDAATGRQLPHAVRIARQHRQPQRPRLARCASSP